MEGSGYGSSEIQDAITVLEFSGKTFGMMLKGGIGFAQGIFKAGKKVKDWSSVKLMQAKMGLHYASKGTHSSMDIRAMEKLTGGNYRIFKIPLERGVGNGNLGDIQNFFDDLKTLKIPFAEMPDLNVGDGFIEIAYNPLDAEKLQSFLKDYKFPNGKTAETINFEDYANNATEEGWDTFVKDAVKNAKAEEAVKKNVVDPEQSIKEIKDLRKDANYKDLLSQRGGQEITITKRLIVSETESHYMTRIPYQKDMFIMLPKQVSYKIDDGKTLASILENEKSYLVFDRDGKKIDKLTGTEIYKRHYDPVSRKIQPINKSVFSREDSLVKEERSEERSSVRQAEYPKEQPVLRQAEQPEEYSTERSKDHPEKHPVESLETYSVEDKLVNTVAIVKERQVVRKTEQPEGYSTEGSKDHPERHPVENLETYSVEDKSGNTVAIVKERPSELPEGRSTVRQTENPVKRSLTFPDDRTVKRPRMRPKSLKKGGR